MTPQYFSKLAATYGPDIQHWPEAERAAAEHIAALPECKQALEEAVMLDEWLSKHIVSPPSFELIERILVDAPTTRQHRHAALWSWLSGIGFAGVGIAGALAGIFCVSLLTGAMRPGDSSDAAIFSDYIDYGQDWR